MDDVIRPILWPLFGGYLNFEPVLGMLAFPSQDIPGCQLPLKNDGWKTASFPFGANSAYFSRRRIAISFREGKIPGGYIPRYCCWKKSGEPPETSWNPMKNWRFSRLQLVVRRISEINPSFGPPKICQNKGFRSLKYESWVITLQTSQWLREVVEEMFAWKLGEKRVWCCKIIQDVTGKCHNNISTIIAIYCT